MNKNYKINYLSKDFSSIRNDLNEYAKRYYSDTLGDLSEASINSFFIESVAYVGDVLSYYLDYQANESFLPTALETKNILNLAKSLGYKETNTTTTVGKVTLYMLLPSDGNNSPDYLKAPTILKGTTLSSFNGEVDFIISDDIEINEDTIGANYVVARTNAVGVPTYYAVKITAPVISGVITEETYSIDSFTKFRKLTLNNPNTVEVLSIIDADGNDYYEVPNLSQNIIYRSFDNTDITTNGVVKKILRPVSAIRRFVFAYDNSTPYVMFGAKEYNLEDDLSINPIAEPSKFIINKYNNDFLQDFSFEPNQLLNGDTFGIGPSNTVLTIRSRSNTGTNNNVSAGQLKIIKSLAYKFKNSVTIASDVKDTIISSVQVVNEEAIIGETVAISNDDVKQDAGMVFQSQNRAVTGKDYEAVSYMMPAKYGSIKRCRAEKDPTSLKNNINLFVVCADEFDRLQRANSKLKENLKYWLSEYKLITDSVDILDAKIINFGINYTIMVDPNYDKLEIKNKVDEQLKFIYSFAPQIGETFNVLDIYRNIQKITGVLDIKDIKILNKTGVGYSQTPFNVEQNTSSDGNTILIPRNTIYEIKFPSRDIIGKVL